MKHIIHILGLGPTLQFYHQDGNLAIGVNDIWRKVQTPAVLVLDEIFECHNPTIPPLESEKRQYIFKVIAQSRPQILYARCESWDFHPAFKKINTVNPCGPAIGSLLTLDDEGQLPIGHDSPFTAACLAYHLGATDIVLHGVDFTTHYLGRDPDTQLVILNYYCRLAMQLKIRAVNLYVNCKSSLLSEVLPWLMKE